MLFRVKMIKVLHCYLLFADLVSFYRSAHMLKSYEFENYIFFEIKGYIGHFKINIFIIKNKECWGITNFIKT